MEETTELIDKYAMQIVDAVRQAAPEVWEAATRAAAGSYVAQIIVGSVLALIAAALLVILFRRFRPNTEMGEGEGFCTLAALLGAVVSVILIVRGWIGMVYWARWDAMKEIMGLIKP